MIVGRVAFRDIRARPGRYLLTVVAIALGVTFVAGAFTLADSLAGEIHDIYGDVYAGVDVVVRGRSPEPDTGDGGATTNASSSSHRCSTSIWSTRSRRSTASERPAPSSSSPPG